MGGTEHATKSRHARYSAGTESIEFVNPTFNARLEHLDIYILSCIQSLQGEKEWSGYITLEVVVIHNRV